MSYFDLFHLLIFKIFISNKLNGPFIVKACHSGLFTLIAHHELESAIVQHGVTWRGRESGAEKGQLVQKLPLNIASLGIDTRHINVISISETYMTGLVAWSLMHFSVKKILCFILFWAFQSHMRLNYMTPY